MQQSQWLERYPSLSMAEFLELLHAWRALPQGPKADSYRKRLIEGNLRLVASISWQIARKNPGWEVDELIASGVPGLIRALEQFDPDRGFAFSTYAVWPIRRSIYTEIRETSLGQASRLPENVRSAKEALRRAIRTFNATHGRNPNRFEIEEIRNTAPQKSLNEFPLNRLSELIELLQNDGTHSLDAPSTGKEHDKRTLLEALTLDQPTPSAESYAIEQQNKKRIRQKLQELPYRTRNIIMLRYGIDRSHEHTLEEVGEIIGLTRERIRQIEQTGLRRLSHLLKRADTSLAPVDTKSAGVFCITKIDKNVRFGHVQAPLLLPKGQSTPWTKTCHGCPLVRS